MSNINRNNEIAKRMNQSAKVSPIYVMDTNISPDSPENHSNTSRNRNSQPQPFSWAIKSVNPLSMQDSSPMSFRSLSSSRRPHIESYGLSSSSGLTSPAIMQHSHTFKPSQSNKQSNGANQKATANEYNDNALLNIQNFKPPRGTPPIIFDPNNVTEVKELPNINFDSIEYLGKRLKLAKSDYLKTNPKIRVKMNLSTNAKHRLVVQNQIHQKHPKSSLDPANLPSKQKQAELNWSKYHAKGSKIREQWDKKLEANRIKKLKLKSKSKEPPGQAKQLINLLNKMITIVADTLYKNFSKLHNFSQKYRTHIIGGSRWSQNQQFISVHEILSRVDIHLNEILEPFEFADTRQHNLTRNRYQQNENNNGTEYVSPDIITTINTTGSNGRHTSHELNNIVRHNGPGFMSESTEEGCLINLIILLSSLPNHRPTVEILAVLIWLLSEASPEVCHQLETSRKNTFLYQAYSKAISQSLNMVTKYVTERSGSEEINKKEKLAAEEHLKTWYTDHFKIFEKTIPITITDLESSINSAKSPKRGSRDANNKPKAINVTPGYEPKPPSGASRPSTATSKASPSTAARSLTVSPHQSPLIVNKEPYRPVSAGHLRSLDSKQAFDNSNNRVHYPSQSVSPGHMKSLIGSNNNNYNNGFASQMSSGSVNYNDMTSGSQSDLKNTGFESVLVKVLSHRGLDSFLLALNWIPSVSTHTLDKGTNMVSISSSEELNQTAIVNNQRKEIDYNNDMLLTCPNRITRCKYTENTCITEKIYSDIGDLVNQSLRAFGHQEMIDDILEVPAPPVNTMYEPKATYFNANDLTNSLSKKSFKKSNQQMSNSGSGKSLQSSGSEFNGSDIDDVLDSLAIETENKLNLSSSQPSSPTSNKSSPINTSRSLSSTWINPSNVSGQSSSLSISKNNKNTKSMTLNPAKISKVVHNDNNNIKYNTNGKAGSSETKTKPKSNYIPKPRQQVEVLSFSRQLITDSGSTDILFNMKYLYEKAPLLDGKQSTMIGTSLLSDCARTIILGVAVLVKHSWSGREVDSLSAQKVLGTSICRIVGDTLLRDLLLWLQANRHTPATFKHANQTSIEVALQNLYSYWSELMINNLNSKNESGDNDSKMMDSEPQDHCRVRLVWPHKFKVNKVFREPHIFVPNMNVM